MALTVPLLVGAGVALGLERFLRSFIFGVRAADPVTLAAVGIGLILVTSLASFLPAARMVRLNPAETLRSE